MADHPFIGLHSRRLVLRRLRDADLATFCQYRSDPQVAQYQEWSTFPEDEGVHFFVAQAGRDPDVEGTWFQMAIEHEETGELIGDCGLHTLPGQPGQVEVGFTLARRHQGRGYATEALTRLFDYVFGDLRKHRVTAVIDARNEAAARLLERLGMRREGHFLQNVWFKGAWGDEYLYALLGREWSPNRSPTET